MITLFHTSKLTYFQPILGRMVTQTDHSVGDPIFWGSVASLNDRTSESTKRPATVASDKRVDTLISITKSRNGLTDNIRFWILDRDSKYQHMYMGISGIHMVDMSQTSRRPPKKDPWYGQSNQKPMNLGSPPVIGCQDLVQSFGSGEVSIQGTMWRREGVTMGRSRHKTLKALDVCSKDGSIFMKNTQCWGGEELFYQVYPGFFWTHQCRHSHRFLAAEPGIWHS